MLYSILHTNPSRELSPASPEERAEHASQTIAAAERTVRVTKTNVIERKQLEHHEHTHRLIIEDEHDDLQYALARRVYELCGPSFLRSLDGEDELLQRRMRGRPTSTSPTTTNGGEIVKGSSSALPIMSSRQLFGTGGATSSSTATRGTILLAGNTNNATTTSGVAASPLKPSLYNASEADVIAARRAYFLEQYKHTLEKQQKSLSDGDSNANTDAVGEGEMLVHPAAVSTSTPSATPKARGLTAATGDANAQRADDAFNHFYHPMAVTVAAENWSRGNVTTRFPQLPITSTRPRPPSSSAYGAQGTVGGSVPSAPSTRGAFSAQSVFPSSNVTKKKRSTAVLTTSSSTDGSTTSVNITPSTSARAAVVPRPPSASISSNVCPPSREFPAGFPQSPRSGRPASSSAGVPNVRYSPNVYLDDERAAMSPRRAVTTIHQPTTSQRARVDRMREQLGKLVDERDTAKRIDDAVLFELEEEAERNYYREVYARERERVKQEAADRERAVMGRRNGQDSFQGAKAFVASWERRERTAFEEEYVNVLIPALWELKMQVLEDGRRAEHQAFLNTDEQREMAAQRVRDEKLAQTNEAKRRAQFEKDQYRYVNDCKHSRTHQSVFVGALAKKMCLICKVKYDERLGYYVKMR